MNILFLDQFAEIGGAQRGLLDLLPAVLGRGWSAEAAVPDDGPLPDRLREIGVTAHRLPCGPYRSGPKSAADLARFTADVPRQARILTRLIESRRFDLLYVNGPRLLPAAALCTRNLPLVFHSHSLISSGWQARVAGRCLRRPRAHVIACCQFVAQPLRRWVDHSRLRIIYNGVDAALPATLRNTSQPRIGLIGRIAPEKGQLDFVRAARIILQTHPDCTFILCGAPLFSAPAYDAAVRTAARELPIEFLGWREDARSVLGTLDLLAVPSSDVDATPRVILEAAAAGIPVVAYRSGGIPEIVEHETSGILTARTPEALAAACTALLSDPAKRTAMSAAALAHWHTRFTLSRHQTEIISTLEQIPV